MTLQSKHRIVSELKQSCLAIDGISNFLFLRIGLNNVYVFDWFGTITWYVPMINSKELSWYNSTTKYVTDETGLDFTEATKYVILKQSTLVQYVTLRYAH